MGAHDLTRHAKVRRQQRAVSDETLDLVMTFGRARRARGRAETFSLDRYGRQAVRSHVGAEAYGKIEKKLGVYVVMADDGRIVTVGHRYKRFRNV